MRNDQLDQILFELKSRREFEISFDKNKEKVKAGLSTPTYSKIPKPAMDKLILEKTETKLRAKISFDQALTGALLVAIVSEATDLDEKLSEYFRDVLFNESEVNDVAAEITTSIYDSENREGNDSVSENHLEIDVEGSKSIWGAFFD